MNSKSPVINNVAGTILVLLGFFVLSAFLRSPKRPQIAPPPEIPLSEEARWPINDALEIPHASESFMDPEAEEVNTILDRLREEYRVSLMNWQDEQKKRDELSLAIQTLEAELLSIQSEEPVAPQEQKSREWTAANGKTMNATLISSDFGNATLKKQDGEVVVVAKNKLIDSDKRIVESTFVDKEVYQKRLDTWEGRAESITEKKNQLDDQIKQLDTPMPVEPALEDAKTILANEKQQKELQEAKEGKPYFRYISWKKDPKNPEDIMHLYWSDKKPLKTKELIELCKEFRDRNAGKRFSYLVVFDSETHAVYPRNPFTAFYGLDWDTLKHIRAYYEYNRTNGYSELTTYDNNAYESPPMIIKIRY